MLKGLGGEIIPLFGDSLTKRAVSEGGLNGNFRGGKKSSFGQTFWQTASTLLAFLSLSHQTSRNKKRAEALFLCDFRGIYFLFFGRGLGGRIGLISTMPTLPITISKGSIWAPVPPPPVVSLEEPGPV